MKDGERIYELSEVPERLLRRSLEFQEIGTRAVRKAIEENRRLGIPNVFSRNGQIYYELPDGRITRKNPFEEEGQE